MEPFGIGNPKPIFKFRNMLNFCKPKIVGDKHIKFIFIDNLSKKRIEAIWFNSVSYYETLKNKLELDLVGVLDENLFNGNKLLEGAFT